MPLTCAAILPAGEAQRIQNELVPSANQHDVRAQDASIAATARGQGRQPALEFDGQGLKAFLKAGRQCPVAQELLLETRGQVAAALGEARRQSPARVGVVAGDDIALMGLKPIGAMAVPLAAAFILYFFS